MEERESDVFERWRGAMAGGFQVVPNQLFLLQRRLKLSSHQIIIILHLAMHWWKKDDLPFIQPERISKRMGVGRRTIERELKKLCEMGLVEKKAAPKNTKTAGYTKRYDLSGLVLKLEALNTVEPKSEKLSAKINRVRADSSASSTKEDKTERKNAPSQELRG